MLMFMKCSANVEAKHLGCYNARCTEPVRIEGTIVTSAQLDTIPVPCIIDKITSSSGDDQYDIPPSKYSPTRQTYDSAHDRMGAMMAALTFEAN